RRIAEPCLRAEQIELALAFPVTTEASDHPGGYEHALAQFYDEAAAALAAHLDAGRDVAVLCEGDPFFYGSYMYLHERLAARYETTVVPGVTGFSAAAASAGQPLVKRDDVFVAVPGTLSEQELAARLRTADAGVVMKLGRTFAKVRRAVARAGAEPRAIYVERASSQSERIAPLAEVDGEVPYMSLVLLPSPERSSRDDALAGEASVQARGHASGARGHASGARGHASGHARGSVAVVGLGPAGPDWLTPEAHAELAHAQELVGYETYLARVPERRWQRRHGSDNRVEDERARHALRLAAAGRRVAVVSSGDPGIFAMASAVIEAQEQDAALAEVEVRIVPGLSAMQAAAARVGAPLGHDFCVLSLSDQLKPWDVLERRLHAAGAADLVLALYNPASRTRREQLARALAILREHRSGQTPVVLARAVGSEQEHVAVSTLAALAESPDAVDMRTLLIVGSSTTRTVSHDGRPARVYTPRRYPA
ncbi:MAG TPA: precorrin-3B C(17)-methyltransferase, partial [Solirubrobacteraceae bacterium]|nr:precorrin-3B C(17)-methyltransferase [Solirubrobacteraceae bacterium]